MEEIIRKYSRKFRRTVTKGNALNEIIFSLEPQDNARLQSLCGAFDEHLALIEKSFNLVISRQGFNFTIQSADENHYSAGLIQNSVKLIKQLYNETAPIKGKIKELDLEDVHLAIQESRMLLQNQWQASTQGDIAIKTKRE